MQFNYLFFGKQTHTKINKWLLTRNQNILQNFSTTRQENFFNTLGKWRASTRNEMQCKVKNFFLWCRELLIFFLPHKEAVIKIFLGKFSLLLLLFRCWRFHCLTNIYFLKTYFLRVFFFVLFLVWAVFNNVVWVWVFRLT